MNAIITTGRKMQKSSVELAEEIAVKLKIPFITRDNLSIRELAKLYQVNNVLILKNGALRLISNVEEIFFHPSLSHLRIKSINNGAGDRMIEAMNLQNGMSILDCTLGLGTDAIVESFIAGAEGQVTALEINPLLAEVVSYGLQHFNDESAKIITAMRRIKVINTDYADFLKNSADNSFDVIYFDPMFRHSLERSSNLKPLRSIVDHRPVTVDVIKEAKRVARKRVVIKENAKSAEFKRLGFEEIYGGKYSPIQYGILKILEN